VKLFSHRKGIKSLKKALQVDSIDTHLRNRLWNAVDLAYWIYVKEYNSLNKHEKRNIEDLLKKIWGEHFRFPLDTLPNNKSKQIRTVRRKFLEGYSWNEVYDFIEFIVKVFPDETRNNEFIKKCNVIMRTESSAYRFVGKEIIQITSEVEISEIEEVLTTPLKPVREHLKKALELLSNKKSPDYSNSIKESISAVETVCNLISGEKIALGQCLNKIQTKYKKHSELIDAFNHLYRYASSENGNRLDALKESDIDYDISKFMLVSCSAFINYLISKELTI
jgi:hypothetical protein